MDIGNNPRSLTSDVRIPLDVGLTLHLAPHFFGDVGIHDRSDGIDNQDGKSNSLKRKSSPIYPISFCVTSYFTMLFGWFRLRFCRSRRDLCFGAASLFLGFWASVLFGVLAVARIF